MQWFARGEVGRSQARTANFSVQRNSRVEQGFVDNRHAGPKYSQKRLTTESFEFPFFIWS